MEVRELMSPPLYAPLRGLMVCIDLVEPDGSGRTLDANRMAELDRKAWDRAPSSTRAIVRLAPPLCISREEVDQLGGVVAESVTALQEDI